MDKIRVKVERMDDVYAGKKTGHIVFHTSTADGCSRLGGVLGRGPTQVASLQDFVWRAECDGHALTVSDLKVVQVSDWVNPS